ncbi:hypothetical protein PAPHI01_0798 [Pancytospora philotis]|nr:hypothetical protein PAPHI01_0798 [Pancytospora philotis]
MLAAGFLLLARYCAAVDQVMAGQPATADYSDFGAISKPGLNLLEQHVLDALSIGCIAYTSPEIPAAIIRARVGRCSPGNIARCSAYAVLKDCHEQVQLSQLLNQLNTDFGYGSHLLLAKLFYSLYVLSRKMQIAAAPAADAHNHDTDRCTAEQAFDNLVGASSDKIMVIIAMLDSTIACECAMTLVEYAMQNKAKNSSTDYALLTIARRKQENSNMGDEFNCLLDYWFSDHSRFRQQYNVISGYVRVSIQLSIMPDDVHCTCKDQIYERVAKRSEPEYLELLRDTIEPEYLKFGVQRALKRLHPDTVSPYFILRYIEFLRKSSNSPWQSMINTWKNYLRGAPNFLRMKTALKESPELFNELPVWVLREVFEHLHKLKNDSEPKDNDMHQFMRLLSFENFLQILWGYNEPAEQDALLVFMTDSLDESKIMAYLRLAHSGRYHFFKRKWVKPLVVKISAALVALVGKMRAVEAAAAAQASNPNCYWQNSPHLSGADVVYQPIAGAMTHCWQ